SPTHHPVLSTFPTRRSSDLEGGDPLRDGRDGRPRAVQNLDRAVPDGKRVLAPGELGVLDARAGVGQVERFPLAKLVRLRLLRPRSEEHTSELQSRFDIVCRL